MTEDASDAEEPGWATAKTLVGGAAVHPDL